MPGHDHAMDAFNASLRSRRPAPAGRSRRAALGLKRGLDLVIAAPLCLILTPVFILIAVAIKLDSKGPVFFRQRRCGQDMTPFTIIKFRSLQDRAADPHARYEMLADDPRITRVGGFLRRTSLDELPQLINVIEGSMSLVGPRPLVDWESRQLLVQHAERFRVKPGITGLSQVSVRNSASFKVRSDKDVEYARQWSVRRDIEILLRTPWCVLRADAIYPDEDTGS